MKNIIYSLEKVSYDEMPQVLIDAIVATEDSRFFQHNGFDLPRFAKASVGQVMKKSQGKANPAAVKDIIKTKLA